VRKLASSDGWQTTAEAVARRVVEDEQEDAVEDEEVVREEDLSDEEADSVGPVKWVFSARSQHMWMPDSVWCSAGHWHFSAP
jgi:hypothetical protein